jgi:hypothetical protein
MTSPSIICTGLFAAATLRQGNRTENVNANRARASSKTRSTGRRHHNESVEYGREGS